MSSGLATEWAQWMNAGGMSSRTISERVDLVSRFEAASGRASVDVDWRPLVDFLANPAFSTGTKVTYHTHLTCWFDWLVNIGARADNPMALLRAPRAPRRRPRPLTFEQLETVLATRMHHRTRAMILLGAYEGFRVSEIARTRGEHYDLAELTVYVHGKGDREDYLPMHETVAELAATMPRRGYWFPSHVRDGQPILGNSVSAMIGHVLERAGVEHRTAHSLRHFYATYLLRTGTDMRAVQELMRHERLATTQIYTEVDNATKRAAVARLPSPARGLAA